MNCALTPKKLENLYIYNFKILLKYTNDDKKEFNLKEHIKSIYDSIYNKSKDSNLATLYAQQVPRMTVLAISNDRELSKTIRKKGLDVAELYDFDDRYEDFEEVIKDLSNDSDQSVKEEDVESIRDEIKETAKRKQTNPKPEGTPEDIEKEEDKKESNKKEIKRDIYSAKPSTALALTGQEEKFNEETGLWEEDPEKSFYYDFLRLIFDKSNDGYIDAENLKIGNHKGFKIKVISKSKLPIDKAMPDEQELFKNEPSRMPDYEKGIGAFITDLEGNILYFDKNYNTVSKEEGMPIYFNLRTPIKNEDGSFYLMKAKIQTPEEILNNELRNGGFDVAEYKKEYPELYKQSLKEIYNVQQEELKQISKIRNALNEDKNKEFLLKINAVSRGMLNYSYNSYEDPNNINWDKSDVSFNPVKIINDGDVRPGEFKGGIFLRIPGQRSIRLQSKNISDKDINIILELLFNPDLKLNNKPLSFDMRKHLLETLVYTNKNSFQLIKSSDKFIVKVEGKLIDITSEKSLLEAKEKVKEILTKPYSKNSSFNTIYGIYNFKTNDKNNIDEVVSIKDNKVELKEVPFDVYAKSHTLLKINLSNKSEKTLKYANNYLMFSVEGEIVKEEEERKEEEGKEGIKKSDTSQKKIAKIKNPTIKKERKKIVRRKREKITRKKKDHLEANKKILLKNSKKQIDKAKKWFDNSELSKYIKLEDLTSIINSEAWAKFKDSAITLYKGSNYTLLYHESWHAFSQQFLSKTEQITLYKAFEKTRLGKDLIERKTEEEERELTEEEKYLVLEEYIAEDFREFMIYGTSELYDNKKVKSIFKRILNFLKSIFTKEGRFKLKIKKYFNDLKTGNFKQYDQSQLNYYFTGKDLHARFEPVEGVEEDYNISEDDTIRLIKSTDSLLLSLIHEENIKVKSSKFLMSVLQNPKKNLPFFMDKVYDKLIDRYNELIEELETIENDNEYLILDEKVNALETLISHFGLNEDNIFESTGFVKLYLEKSILNTLEVDLSKEQSFFEKQLSDKEESLLEKLDVYTKFLLSINKERDEYGNLVKDEFGVPKLLPFNDAYALIKSLSYQNNDSPKTIINKLKEELSNNRNYWVKELIDNLGDPNTGDTDLFRLQSKFWQDFFYSKTPLIQTNIDLKNQNSNTQQSRTVDVKVGEASAVHRNLANDITSHFKTVRSNRFIKFVEGVGNVLDTDAILKKYNEKYTASNNYNEFFKDIGLNLSYKPDLKNKDSDILRDAAGRFITLIREKNKIGYQITDIIKDLREKTIYYEKDVKKVLEGENTSLRNVLNLELKNSIKYANVGLSTPDGNVKFEDHQFSTIDILIKDINNLNHYSEIYKYPHLSEFWIENNDWVKNSAIFHSLFIWNESLQTFEDRNKSVKLEKKEISGTQVIEDDHSNLDYSAKTSNVDESTRILQDIHNGLLLGAFSNITPSDKGTIISVTTNVVSSYKNEDTASKTKRLYVDYQGFGKLVGKHNAAIVKAGNIMIGYLDAELKRINKVKKHQETGEELPNILGYTVPDSRGNIRGLEFGILDDVLNFKKGLKEKLLKLENADSLKSFENLELYNEFLDAVNDYFNWSYEQTLGAIEPSLFFITKEILNTAKKQLKDLGFENKDLTLEALRRVALKTYVVNSFLHHAENFIFSYGDLAQYKDIFKRNYAFQSQGNMHRTDQEAVDFVNGVLGRPFEKKYKKEKGIDEPIRRYDNKLNTVVFEEVTVQSELIGVNDDGSYKEYTKAVIEDLIERGYSKELAIEIEKIVNKAYYSMDEGDAGACLNFDTYRILSYLNDSWSDKQEELYQKILNNPEEILTTDILEYFPPRKFQYFGALEMSKFNAKALHKYSLFPLIPTVIKNTNLERLSEIMYEQGIDYATYESGSKVSTIVPKGKKSGETLYSDLKNRILESRENGEPLVKNVIYTHFLKDQLKINSKFKKKTIFSTQLRTLIEDSLIENGIPVDFEKDLPFFDRKEKWESLTELEKFKKSFFYSKFRRYENKISKYIEVQKILLKKELGLYDQNSDKTKLVSVIKEELSREDLAEHELDFIRVDENGKLDIDLSFSPSAAKIERTLNAIVNNRIVKQKMKGESLVQVPTTLFEPRKATQAEKKKYGATNDMKSYTKDPKTGKTNAAEFKIALQGDFKKLLHLKHKDGKKIMVYKKRIYTKPDGTTKYIKEVDQKESLKRLNETIQDAEWRSKEENKRLISMIGVRIPVQGLNSMEHMIVWEFLPEEAGNIIIPPSEIVAKSGADFDVDKLTVLFPGLELINGEVHFIEDTNDSSSAQESLDKVESLKEKIKELEKQKNDLRKKYSLEYSKISNSELTEKQRLERNEILKPFYDESDELEPYADLIESQIDKLESIKNKSKKQQQKLEELYEQYDDIMNKIDDLYDRFEKAKKEIGKKFFEEKFKKFEETRDAELNPVLNELKSLKLETLSNSTSAIQNSILIEMRDILSLEYNFLNLIRPNSTDLFTSGGGIVDEMSTYKDSYFKSTSPTRALEPKKNANVHARNSIGKSTLGISANANVFNTLLNRIGAVLNHSYRTKKGEKRKVFIKLNHNKIGNNISLSNIFSKDGVRISDIINQLMNGYVDIAKEDWVFDINAGQEAAPTLLFLIMAGVPYKEAIYFLSNPLIKEYIKERQNLASSFSKATGYSAESIVFNKNKAKFNILSKFEELEFVLDYDKSSVKQGKLYNYTYNKLKKVDTFDVERIGKMFFEEALDDEEALLGFLHFLQLEDIGKHLNYFRKAVKLDTVKNTTLFDAINKENEIKKLSEVGLLDESYIKKAFEETPTGKFRVGPYQLELWQPLFKIRTHPRVTSYLSDVYDTYKFNKDVRMTFNDEEKYIEEFKNDLIIAIFENSLLPKSESILNEGSYKGVEIIKTDEDLLIELFEEDEEIKFKINLEKLKEAYDKSLFSETKSSLENSFDKLGLNSLPLYTFSDGYFDSFFNYMLELTYLRYDFHIDYLKHTRLFNQEYAKHYNQIEDLEKDDQINFVYEKLISKLALNRTLNPRKIFKSSESLANEIFELMDIYPELKEKYYLLSQLKISSTKTDDSKKIKITNLALIDTKVDSDIYKLMNSNMLDLMSEDNISVNDSPEGVDITWFENRLVAEYFKTLQYAAFMQSGLNTKDFLSLIRIMDQSLIAKELDNVNIDSLFYRPNFFKGYSSLFYNNNSINNVANRKRFKNYFDSILFHGMSKSKSVNTSDEESSIDESSVLNPEDFVNHSGGAYGADTLWDIIGREFGVTDHKHYRDKENSNLSKKLKNITNATILTKDQINESREKVNKLLNKNYKDDIQGNLQSRNYYQVKNADAVFAISKLKNNKREVSGGTNTAVQLAIIMEKPVHVWDVNTEKWYTYKNGKFVEEDTPTLTKNFAGVGTRDIENYNTFNKATKKWESREQYVGDEKAKKAEQAIRDVYEKTFNKKSSQTTPTLQDVSEYSNGKTESPNVVIPKKSSKIQPPKGTINVYWGQSESEKSTRILSNLAPRKFTYTSTDGIEREYGSVEHAYQSNKNGKFDKAVYDAYIKKGGYGVKISPKLTEVGKRGNLQLMKDLVVESFIQNPNSEAAKKLLMYENFTHNTNQLIDKAFLEGLKLAQKELFEIIKEINKNVDISDNKTFNTKVSIIDKYDVNIVKNNPDKIYIFGDNVVGKGKKGQAIIRDEENSFGIPTKKLPFTSEESYFSDKEFKENKEYIDKAIDKIKKDGREIVFPKDGIGTGLAKLKEKAPKTWEYLNKKLLDEFGFNNETGEVIRQQSQTQETTQPVSETLTGRIQKKYPKEIEWETLAGKADTKKLQEIANLKPNKIVPFKKGTPYGDIVEKLYGKHAARYVRDTESELSENEGEFLRDNPEFAKNFISDFLESELGEGETMQSFAKKLLEKYVIKIDTFQTSLFDNYYVSEILTESGDTIESLGITQEEWDNLTQEEKDNIIKCG
jgi:hypothetical protein